MADVQVIVRAPNQKVIETVKTASDRENTYSIINIDAVMSAMRNLSDRDFKLYLRMALHQNGYCYGLSPVEIEKSTGLSAQQYSRARKGLEESGYLVEYKDRKNVYKFYEYPEADNPEHSKLTGNSIISDTSNYPEVIHKVSDLTPTVSEMIPTTSEMIPTVSDLKVSSIKDDAWYNQKRGNAISEIRGEILQDNTNNNTAYNTSDNTMDTTNYITDYNTKYYEDDTDEAEFDSGYYEIINGKEIWRDGCDEDDNLPF